MKISTYFSIIDFFGKDKIIDALKELKFSSNQIEISLYLLEGLSYKEIQYKMNLPVLNAVTQRIRKIYRKCKVLSRAAFYNRILERIKTANFSYPPE